MPLLVVASSSMTKTSLTRFVPVNTRVNTETATRAGWSFAPLDQLGLAGASDLLSLPGRAGLGGGVDREDLNNHPEPPGPHGPFSRRDGTS